MPGKRSYVCADGPLTAAQQRRRERDNWYTTSHSGVGRKFVEVDASFVSAAKAMIRGRAVHIAWDHSNGFSSNRGRNAFSAGHISRRELDADFDAYKNANSAKHGKPTWADTSIEDEEVADAVFLTIRGPNQGLLPLVFPP